MRMSSDAENYPYAKPTPRSFTARSSLLVVYALERTWMCSISFSQQLRSSARHAFPWDGRVIVNPLMVAMEYLEVYGGHPTRHTARTCIGAR